MFLINHLKVSLVGTIKSGLFPLYCDCYFWAGNIQLSFVSDGFPSSVAQSYTWPSLMCLRLWRGRSRTLDTWGQRYIGVGQRLALDSDIWYIRNDSYHCNWISIAGYASSSCAHPPHYYIKIRNINVNSRNILLRYEIDYWNYYEQDGPS